MLSENFYRAFEERHYAPREIIKELRKQYLIVAEPLSKIYENGNTYDAGCGRGEWLELMNELSFQSFGVDLDDGMLAACYERDLNVLKGDAVEYIKTLESSSQVIVSAFHVVEHISFTDLQVFVQEALRVLKPGGILIMETPNPENIKVATENFYLDPTHIKPIPSGLLSFLPEFYGYNRTKILRLQELKGLINKENINIMDMLGGVSPDYAVVAQKDADENVLKVLDDFFEKDYGLSLETLSLKFENRLNVIEAKATQAENKATQAEAKATQAEAKATQAEAKATQAEAKATQAEANYHALLNSTSWKATKPLRIISRYLKWFYRGVKHWVTLAPSSRPRRVARKLLNSLKGQEQKTNNAQQLSPRAQKIYSNLQEAIRQKQGKSKK